MNEIFALLGNVIGVSMSTMFVASNVHTAWVDILILRLP